MKLFLILYVFSSGLYAVDFNKEIKPILARKCFSCHGSKKQKGKLRLDEREHALKVLSEKKGIVEFLSRINHKDTDEVMPPPEDGKLSTKEKKLLEKWIEEGAKYEKHWSFQSIKKPTPPIIENKWISNGIDKFILNELDSKGLNPQPVIFDYNLLKRVSFKLTGLPPSTEELNLLKHGKLNYKDYVRKLLQSSSYGEHMATFWLDGARYADTNGIEYDNSRPIWPYRDWVIKAFNDNMPYDQFITEQVAGDLLPNSSLSQKIATGFLRCNTTTNETGAIEEEFQVRYAKDRLNTSMTAITGLTVSCAECHDHKYDPISQKEYYQLLAYFNNIDGLAVGLPQAPANEPLVLTDLDKYKKYQKLNLEKKFIEKQMVAIRNKNILNFQEWHRSNLDKPSKALYELANFELFFSFDETNNAKIINIINDEKGELRGPILRVNGKHEYGLRCTNSFYIDCPRTSIYDNTSKFSAGFWINPDQGSTGEILGQFYNFKGWKIEIKDGFIIFTLSNSKEKALIVQSELKLQKDEWSHITVSYDGSATPNSINFYINSKKAESRIIQNNLDGSTRLNAILRVASYLDNVTIDDIFITKGLLSQEQIALVNNFNASSRFVHYRSEDMGSRNLKRLENYYFENFDPKHSQMSKVVAKINAKIYLLLKYGNQSLVMKEKETLKETHILLRGDYQQKGEKVSRAVPTFISDIPTQTPANRLGLAKWLTHKKNPMTARVIVNRIWLRLFNRGLYSTPDDLGIQGTYPSHPLLLDYLSSYLIENKWNVKKLITFIVSSSTFQQRSHNNDQFSSYNSYPKHRLSAEELRDQLLVLSKLLNPKVGGAPVFPYQPSGLWSEITADGSDTRFFVQSKGKDNYRRSIYTFWKRSLPPPFMTLFDAPSREVCSIGRQETNTPLQALSLMNDPQFTELYNSIIKQTELFKTKNQQISFIFNKLFYRDPKSKEISLSSSLKSKKDIRIFIHALLNTDEFITIK